VNDWIGITLGPIGTPFFSSAKFMKSTKFIGKYCSERTGLSDKITYI
jgi:hypothetical protein